MGKRLYRQCCDETECLSHRTIHTISEMRASKEKHPTNCPNRIEGVTHKRYFRPMTQEQGTGGKTGPRCMRTKKKHKKGRW